MELSQEAKEQPEKCRYCGGNCPNESDDSPNLCDGFAGDIDKLYSDEAYQVARLKGETL
tara:strand:+ start:104 stop:280 length:177 start_codon:yes stop_codon:yes gene_type:complete